MPSLSRNFPLPMSCDDGIYDVDSKASLCSRSRDIDGQFALSPVVREANFQTSNGRCKLKSLNSLLSLQLSGPLMLARHSLVRFVPTMSF